MDPTALKLRGVRVICNNLGPIAQLVVRLVCNEEVRSSNLLGSTLRSFGATRGAATSKEVCFRILVPQRRRAIILPARHE